MSQKKKLPFVTVGFVAVNVLVYVILEILGNTENSEFMVRMGAVWPPYVKQGEYWRLFTATFMHFGFEHILNNMLVLICAGPILEKAMGHIKYLCLYLIAGVGGSTLSYVQMIARGKYDVSAGASGAIFGINEPDEAQEPLLHQAARPLPPHTLCAQSQVSVQTGVP